MMLRKHAIHWAPILALSLAACGGSGEAEGERDLSLMPAESLAALSDQPVEAQTAEQTPQAAAPATRSSGGTGETQGVETRQPEITRRPPRPAAPPTLEVGTQVTLVASDTTVANHSKVGDPVYATVASPILDANGREVIPAGAVFVGTIANYEEAASDYEGHMLLRFNQVEFGGGSYPIDAQTLGVGTRTQKQGVTTGDAAKVGVGAVAGAIAGRIIGGNKTGTAVGAVVGAAAGVGVAAATKGEDVYLDAGAPIRIVLTTPFVRS